MMPDLVKIDGSVSFTRCNRRKRMEVARAGADFGIEAGHGFEVVVEHVRTRGDDGFQRGGRAFQEIGRQNLDGGVWGAVTDRADGLGKMFGPAIRQVVAVHRGDDHVVQTQLLHGIGHATRLERIQRVRPAGGDVAEGAAAGADVAHDHHGGVTLAPAFAGIGATRLFADRHQLVFAHDAAGFVIPVAGWCLHPDPAWLLRLGIVRAMRLFGMALFGYLEVTQRFFPAKSGATQYSI